METEHNSALDKEKDEQKTDAGALFCGTDRSTAPCTFCDWIGICPQHKGTEK